MDNTVKVCVGLKSAVSNTLKFSTTESHQGLAPKILWLQLTSIQRIEPL